MGEIENEIVTNQREREKREMNIGWDKGNSRVIKVKK